MRRRCWGRRRCCWTCVWSNSVCCQPGAVHERDRTLKSALHYCAENATAGCAEVVLGAAPELLDARDEDGYSTLHLAVIAGNCPLIRLLLARGADVNCLDNERHSVVHWATGTYTLPSLLYLASVSLKHTLIGN